MKLRQLSRNGSIALAVASLALILGSGIAYAEGAHVFTSDTQFQVVDPAEPVIETNVPDGFANQSIRIQVNMSSHEGVAKLTGTYTIVVQAWDDNASAFVNFETLVSKQSVTLTPTPTVLNFSFESKTPGYFNLHIEFTATSWTKG